MVTTRDAESIDRVEDVARWRRWVLGCVRAGGVGFVVGLVVCLPWIGRGWVIFLDWVPSPHAAILPSQVFGLSGGLIAALPLGLLDAVLVHLVGSSAVVVEVIGFFILASWSIERLVGGGWIRVIGAELLFCVNPFVFDRLYAGQIGILLGYALLPFAIVALLEARTSGWVGWVRVGVWWALLIGCAPHFVWIFAVPLVLVVVTNIRRPRLLVGVALSAVFAFLTTGYVLVAGGVGGVGLRIGIRNLEAFQTSPDRHYGLFVNVLGLYGFWRLGPTLAKQVITGWPVLLLALLVLIVFGYAARWRGANDARWDRQAIVILVGIGIGGIILAMGAQGPFGSVFTWMYTHIPYFNIMREPEKFSMLVALCYAVGLGFGAEALTATAKGNGAKALSIAAVIVVVLTYEPLLFLGLGGQISPSRYPPSWYRANQLMGEGQGRVLALPWHQYLSYPFTGNRVVANLSPGFFTRPVIAGDNVQLPNIPTSATTRQSRFIQYAIDHGDQTQYFGSLVEPLGVKYVVLEKTVDWRLYGWLHAQRDLKELMNTPSLVVFENTAYRGATYRSNTSVTVANWGTLLALSERNLLVNALVRVRHAYGGPLVAPASVASELARAPDIVRGQVVPTSRTSVRELRGGGWITIDDSFEPGWSLQGNRGFELAEGTLGVRNLRSAGADVTFGQASLVEAAEAVALLVFVIGVVAVVRQDVLKSRALGDDNHHSEKVMEGTSLTG